MFTGFIPSVQGAQTAPQVIPVQEVYLDAQIVRCGRCGAILGVAARWSLWADAQRFHYRDHHLEDSGPDWLDFIRVCGRGN